jgi:hypothetical protein
LGSRIKSTISTWPFPSFFLHSNFPAEFTLKGYIRLRVIIRSLNFLMMFSKNYFHCFHQERHMIKLARVCAVHTHSHPAQETFPVNSYLQKVNNMVTSIFLKSQLVNQNFKNFMRSWLVRGVARGSNKS